MNSAPLPFNKTPNPKFLVSDSFELIQDDIIYQLNIKIIEQNIIFNIINKNNILEEYETELNLEELKQIHKIFYVLNSSQEFLDYIKDLFENKKLSIKKKDENLISIIIIIDYLLKQNSIDITLNKKDINFELIAKDLYQKFSILTINFQQLAINYNQVNEKNVFLENEIKKIKDENIILKDKIIKLEENIYGKDNNIKEENKITPITDYLNNDNKKSKSKIMKDDEFIIIKNAIEERINKKIIDIKKLYQATIDGGEGKIFHNKCDRIPNTLILIESKGNRRFGGFASECWEAGGKHTIDKNCFLFSLDKKKIYPPKKNNYYKICNYAGDGPNFSYNKKICISVGENVIKHNDLRTTECMDYFDDLFNNDKNALSECPKFGDIYANDYEVFQIIFSK